MPVKPPAERLFFAFIDGVFHHVCAECDALCCRGMGFRGSLQREMPTLITLYPVLQSMAVSRWGNILTFASPAGRCFFLGDDKLCGIEQRHGKALKPGICVLFPFNVFIRIGKVIAVSPSFICPLRIQVPARPDEVEGAHAKIAASLDESGMLDEAYIETQVPQAVLHRSEDAASALRRETVFRDACALALGKRRFGDLLREQSSDVAAFDECVARALQVMGLPQAHGSASPDAVDDLLIALAPPLRMHMLRLSAEGALRALALGEAALRQVLPLMQGQTTAQGAHQVLIATGPAARLLAQADEPLDLGKIANLQAPAFGDSEMSLTAFRALREICQSRSALSALERILKPSMTAAARAVLLFQFGSQIEPLLRPSRQRSTVRQ